MNGFNCELMSNQARMLQDNIRLQRAYNKHNPFPKYSFKGMAACMYVDRVYDGDTIHALFFCGSTIMSFPLRMIGYDSPEMKPHFKKKVAVMRKGQQLSYIDMLGQDPTSSKAEI